MAFDNKRYPNRKDQRAPYRGAKASCRSCRNHGRCGYCKGNRTYQRMKAESAAKQELKMNGYR